MPNYYAKDKASVVLFAKDVPHALGLLKNTIVRFRYDDRHYPVFGWGISLCENEPIAHNIMTTLRTVESDSSLFGGSPKLSTP